MGKRYDFNYDVQTRDRLGCAELVYHAYGHVDWPKRRGLGRATIVPDDIAVGSLGEGPLELISLYVDGEPVAGDGRQALARLLQSAQHELGGGARF
jgi:hypothetical protein